MNGTVLLILLGVVVIGALVALVPLGSADLAPGAHRPARAARAHASADGLAQRADLAAQKAAALGDKGQDLSDRLTELQGSVARVNVLVGAMREASERWGRLRRYVR